MCNCEWCGLEIVNAAQRVSFGGTPLHADCLLAMNDELDEAEGQFDGPPMDVSDEYDYVDEIYNGHLQAEAEAWHSQYDYE